MLISTVIWDATTITLVSGAVAGLITALTTSIIAIINATKAGTKADMNTVSLDRQANHLVSHDEQITTLANQLPPTAPPQPNPRPPIQP